MKISQLTNLPAFKVDMKNFSERVDKYFNMNYSAESNKSRREQSILNGLSNFSEDIKRSSLK